MRLLALVLGAALAVPALAVAAWWAMVGPNAFELRYEWSWRRGVALTAAFGAALALAVQTDVIGDPWMAYVLWSLAGVALGSQAWRSTRESTSVMST
jgi:hypothetical protein